MRSLIILMVIALSGCTLDTSIAQINKAIEVCANNGGLHTVRSVDNEEIKYAYCSNGAKFRLTSDDL